MLSGIALGLAAWFKERVHLTTAQPTLVRHISVPVPNGRDLDTRSGHVWSTYDEDKGDNSQQFGIPLYWGRREKEQQREEKKRKRNKERYKQ